MKFNELVNPTKSVNEMKPIDEPGDDDSLPHWYARQFAEDEYLWDIAGYSLMVRGGLQSRGPHVFFVVNDDDEPIGYIQAGIGDGFISVSMFYVHTEYRGQGIAMEFYKHWLTDAKINIMSDTEMSVGMSDIWLRLAKEHPLYKVVRDGASGKYVPAEEIFSETDMDTVLNDGTSATRLLLGSSSRTTPFKGFFD